MSVRIKEGTMKRRMTGLRGGAAAVGITLAACLSVHGATVTWVGPWSNGTWSTAANWDSNPNLPGENDDVAITNATLTVVDVSFTNRSLTLGSGVVVVTNTGGSMLTLSNVTVNGKENGVDSVTLWPAIVQRGDGAWACSSDTAKSDVLRVKGPITGAGKITLSIGDWSTIYLDAASPNWSGGLGLTRGQFVFVNGGLGTGPVQIGSGGGTFNPMFVFQTSTDHNLATNQITVLAGAGTRTFQNQTGGAIVTIPAPFVLNKEWRCNNGNAAGMRTILTGPVSGEGGFYAYGQYGPVWYGYDNFTIEMRGTTNTYRGKTKVEWCVLDFKTIANVGNTNVWSPSSLGAPTNAADGTIALGSPTLPGSPHPPTASTLRFTGTNHCLSDRVINLAHKASGNFSDYPLVLDASGSNAVWTLDNGTNAVVTGTNQWLTLDGTNWGTGRINSPIGITTGRLIKKGRGQWILAGTNTFYGGVEVTNGTLTVDGRLAHANITIYSNATLSGSGTIAFNNGETISIRTRGTNSATSLAFDLSALTATPPVTLVDYSGGGVFFGPTPLDNLLAPASRAAWALRDTGSAIQAEAPVRGGLILVR
jgi:autotransporter-associated beta strand protein